jgi:uncharacterized SAM-binding protein YcdF (DUF218 family)
MYFLKGDGSNLKIYLLRGACALLVLIRPVDVLPHENLILKKGLVLLAGEITDRTLLAATIYKKDSSSQIILTNDGVRSRWSKKHHRNLFNIEWTEELLTESGVPSSSIVKLPFIASGTVHDARAVRTYLASHPVNSLLLVTSDYHAKRSLWIFKRVLKDMPVTVTVASVKSGWSSTAPILLEPIKTVYYWVRYGLLEQP